MKGVILEGKSSAQVQKRVDFYQFPDYEKVVWINLILALN